MTHVISQFSWPGLWAAQLGPQCESPKAALKVTVGLWSPLRLRFFF